MKIESRTCLHALNRSNKYPTGSTFKNWFLEIRTTSHVSLAHESLDHVMPWVELAPPTKEAGP